MRDLRQQLDGWSKRVEGLPNGAGIAEAATALKEHGAQKVVAYCTHAVLSGGAVPRIAASDMDEIVVTDTIPLSADAQACAKIRQLSCAQLLAETMTRISNEESVSSLFTE